MLEMASIFADLASLVLVGLLITRPHYQTKFVHLVGALFVLAIGVKYLSDYPVLGVALQMVAIILCFIQNYVFYKHRLAIKASKNGKS